MTTAPTATENTMSALPLPAPITQLLRLEGLAIATTSALLYARTGDSWWLFAALWLAPDLSILGYLLGPCRGSRSYTPPTLTHYQSLWLFAEPCCTQMHFCPSR